MSTEIKNMYAIREIVLKNIVKVKYIVFNDSLFIINV